MLADLERKNARKLKAELESAGFTCVEMVSLRDVTTGILTKAGSVDSVIINGNEARPGFYRADTVIKVVYHGFVLGK